MWQCAQPVSYLKSYQTNFIYFYELENIYILATIGTYIRSLIIVKFYLNLEKPALYSSFI